MFSATQYPFHYTDTFACAEQSKIRSTSSASPSPLPRKRRLHEGKQNKIVRLHTFPFGALAGLPLILVYGNPTKRSQASSLVQKGDTEETTSETLGSPATGAQTKYEFQQKFRVYEFVTKIAPRAENPALLRKSCHAIALRTYDQDLVVAVSRLQRVEYLSWPDVSQPFRPIPQTDSPRKPCKCSRTDSVGSGQLRQAKVLQHRRDITGKEWLAIDCPRDALSWCAGLCMTRSETGGLQGSLASHVDLYCRRNLANAIPT